MSTETHKSKKIALAFMIIAAMLMVGGAILTFVIYPNSSEITDPILIAKICLLVPAAIFGGFSLGLYAANDLDANDS